MTLGAQAVPEVTRAIVLAGGLGTRLRNTVADVPKPMAPINGRPFLEYQLDYWIGQGIREFILSVGYKRDSIIGHFGSHYRRANIRYAIEDSPLGTGGGLLMAASMLDMDQNILVLNGDTFFEVSLAALTEFHADRHADWTFSLFRTNETDRYMGMRVAQDGQIDFLCPEMIGQPELLANGGVYLIQSKVLNSTDFITGFKISLEDDILSRLYTQKTRIFGYESSGRFIDIGLPHDYFRASGFLSS